MKTASRNGFSKFIKSAAAVLLIAAVTALSIGCSLMNNLFERDDISFSKSRLTLYVGDEYNLSKLIETENSSYTLKSSNTSVAVVDDNTLLLTAVGVGTATVTAETSSSSASLKVVVKAKEVDSVTISSSGELVQTFGKTSAVTFTAQATGAPSTADSVYWLVNNKLVKLLDKTAAFEFVPSAVGEYTVTAKCGDVTSDGITVRVFNEVSAQVNVAGDLTQDGTFTSIVFTVTVSGEQTDNYFQYYEDDIVLYEGDLSSFTYYPNPGRHTLSVKVNGQVEYSGEACFVGAIVPVVYAGLVYDNMYPHAYLTFDAVGSVKVEITRPGGEAVEYSQTDSRYKDLFDKGRMDVGGLIDICAADSTQRAYRFRVKSMGDGDAIIESEYSDYITFTQLPKAAEKYVKTVLPCGDLYVTSDLEYVSVLEYYVYFREKKADTTVRFDCYLGYKLSGTAKSLFEDAFHIAATSGVYKEMSASEANNIMHTEFTVNTVNTPYTQTTGTARAKQLHAVIPHINFDSSKYRPTDYVFAVDKIERTAEVAYTDELFLAVQDGVRPLPKTGSSAYTVYQKARAILRMICTDDMTDEEKAHAIYDWITWQVTYDTPATKMTGSEKYSAYYLEGVFGDGVSQIGGVAYNPNAVCDGMSKAYSLLCNMEGIPCVRVVGRAGKSTSSLGGHAWNKVCLNGKWYVVDCTWGDNPVTVALDNVVREYELGLHSYLFLTDAQVSGTHYEPYRSGESTLCYSPKTASSPINVYENMSVNGTKINCYISATQNQSNRLSEIATEFAKAYKKRDSISVPGVSAPYDLEYQGIEIYTDSGFTLSDSNIVNTVTNAIKTVLGKKTIVKVLIMDGCALVLIQN